MSYISLPKSLKIIESDKNRAVFQLEALYPGYGATIGNALRRVLYSSLPGAAITSVKIKGAAHEFTTLPHILEDVLNITLNLKEVGVLLHGDEPQKLTLSAKGKKKVKAGDISAPSQAEIVTPDVHIATLTHKDAKLDMEMTAERGLGYVLADQAKKEKQGVGDIALDASFTPVRKVNYTVENMRVGDRTDFNRLQIEIITDGSVAPEDALLQASQILVDHFSFFTENVQPSAKRTPVKKRATKKKTIKKKTTKKK